MEATAASRLPFVDELSIEIAADPEAVWEALLQTIERSFDSPRTGRFARLLGCHDLESSGARPLATASAFPGFHVEVAEPARELALAGSHRFSDYTLTFRFDELAGEKTGLRAETRATFPGFKGSTYRALVIGTRGHVLATNRMLSAVKRRAESA
jgi:hypothetical protein